MFAGIGAKDKQSPFLTEKSIQYNSATERMILGMIADISRIRIGDKIVFYLQSSVHGPGSFFGVFQAISNPFFDENDSENYLQHKTKKALLFRILIDGFEVFPKGVTEHEYLDSLEGKTHPHELCWSLIYRKLKGNRGCTMITDYEYDDLYNKLVVINNNTSLANTSFTFNKLKCEIENSSENNNYTGRTNAIDILPRLLFKLSKKNAFETHLQAFLTKNIDNSLAVPLFSKLDDSSLWIGNEVACGVGMQRIDILLIEENQDKVIITVIELKDEKPFFVDVIRQLDWYIEWLSYYVVPNYSEKNIRIIPVIIANGKPDNNPIYSSLKYNNKTNSVTIDALQYIGFSVINNTLSFKRYF